MIPRPPSSTLFPYPTLFRSRPCRRVRQGRRLPQRTLRDGLRLPAQGLVTDLSPPPRVLAEDARVPARAIRRGGAPRSEEHTSELRHQIISYAVFCLKHKTPP